MNQKRIEKIRKVPMICLTLFWIAFNIYLAIRHKNPWLLYVGGGSLLYGFLFGYKIAVLEIFGLEEN